MRMIKQHKYRGYCQYEIRDSEDTYFGWLFRDYRPILTMFGRESNYDWFLGISADYPIRFDDYDFDTFKEAKQWLRENVE